MRGGLELKLGLQMQHAPRVREVLHARDALHSREERKAAQAEKTQDVRNQCSPYGLSLAVAAFNPALAVGFDRGVHLLAAACVTKN